MFISLFKFEAYYQLKQRAFTLFSILFLYLGYFAGSQGTAQEELNFNSPYQIAYNTGIFTLGCVFVIMFFAVSGVLRDRHYNSEALIYSTSIKKHQFFLSRFLGVFFFSILTFSPFLFGFYLSTLFANLDSLRIAPFNLVSYAVAWTTLILPNIFICASVIFSVSLLTKSHVSTYIGAILIYVLYWICSIFLNSPLLANAIPISAENLALAALADPFGLSAFFEQTQFWTAFQKNSDVLSLSGYFLWNRVIWTCIALGLLGVTYVLFSFRMLNQKIKKPRVSEEPSYKVKAYSPLPVQLMAYTQWKAFCSLLKIELNSVFKGLPFMGIIFFWLVIVISEMYSKINQGGPYLESWYPVTYLLIREFTGALPVLSILLIVFYSGEMVWRERSLHFNSISDATRVSNLVVFSAKFVALTLLPVLLIASAIACAVIFQLSKGYFHFEPAVYLSIFYYQGISILFFIFLALFIQTLARNKYLGMGITLLLIIMSGDAVASRIGIEHPLFRLGRLPETIYTDMTGHDQGTKAYHHYAIYWMSLGLLLALLSFRFWQRGTTHTLKFKVKRAFADWPVWQRVSMLIAGIVWILSATLIFYNTNFQNRYQTIAEELDEQENYERRYKRYEDIPRLYILKIKTKVDLFPDQNRYGIKAEYVLVNNSDTVITRMMITEREMLINIQIENAQLLSYDPEPGIYIFDFKKPVLPKQQVHFSYTVNKILKGYEVSNTLVNNGTYLGQNSFEPILQYQDSKEIIDRLEREERGLSVRREQITTDLHLQQEDAGAGKVEFETLLSTPKNQQGIAPGELLKAWTDGDRNYYRYKAFHKITPAIAYFSGNYEMKKEMYNGLSIQQYYQPGHDFNVNAMTGIVKKTLDYCTEHFGAYPFRHLRIVEVPAHWSFGGFAHPGTISMVENRLYLIDNRDPEGFDLVAKRTIHEVAHQWWGHILTPRNIAGGSLFTEGFAKYTEAVLMEKQFGLGSVWHLARNANSTYFSERSVASGKEPPVYLVDGQGYISYGKSHTVLMALKDLIGEEKINQILKTITKRYRIETTSSLTSLELLNEIYKVTPVEYHSLVNDWFKKVIVYNLAVTGPSVLKLKDGRYQVTFNLKAQRFESQNDGSQKAIDIKEPIAIGVFTQHPGSLKESDNVLYLKPSLITQEKSTVRIIVNAKPAYLAIDPFGTRSDKNLEDNLIEL